MVESSSQLWLTIKAGCSGDGSMNSARGREIVLPVGGDGDKDGEMGMGCRVAVATGRPEISEERSVGDLSVGVTLLIGLPLNCRRS
jgi:hypothetical protein